MRCLQCKLFCKSLDLRGLLLDFLFRCLLANFNPNVTESIPFAFPISIPSFSPVSITSFFPIPIPSVFPVSIPPDPSVFPISIHFRILAANYQLASLTAICRSASSEHCTALQDESHRQRFCALRCLREQSASEFCTLSTGIYFKLQFCSIVTVDLAGPDIGSHLVNQTDPTKKRGNPNDPVNQEPLQDILLANTLVSNG